MGWNVLFLLYVLFLFYVLPEVFQNSSICRGVERSFPVVRSFWSFPNFLFILAVWTFFFCCTFFSCCTYFSCCTFFSCFMFFLKFSKLPVFVVGWNVLFLLYVLPEVILTSCICQGVERTFPVVRSFWSFPNFLFLLAVWTFFPFVGFVWPFSFVLAGRCCLVLVLWRGMYPGRAPNWRARFSYFGFQGCQTALSRSASGLITKRLLLLC